MSLYLHSSRASAYAWATRVIHPGQRTVELNKQVSTTQWWSVLTQLPESLDYLGSLQTIVTASFDSNEWLLYIYDYNT